MSTSRFISTASQEAKNHNALFFFFFQSGKGKGTQEKSADHKEEMIAKRTMNQGKRQSKRLRRDQESEPMEADNEKPDDEESEPVQKDK